MKLLGRVAPVLSVLAVWLVAKHTSTPASLATGASALAVLVLPGLCIERCLYGTAFPCGWQASPARWLTLSCGTIALLGLAVSSLGGAIGQVLLALAALSLALAACSRRGRQSATDPATEPDFGERVSRVSVVALAGVVVAVAAAAPSIARDRMWYLAFITRLASGAELKWAEPFLGTGEIAARFAHNDWLLALAAWSSLAGAAPQLVFERLSSPLLCIAVVSAAWHFASRAVPGAPALAALATLTTVLATRFPYFSPDRYPFFARLAEDKSVALLVFMPVAMAAVADVTRRDVVPAASRWIALTLCLVAVGFSHGLIVFYVCVSLVTLVLLARAGAEIDRRRAFAALVLAACIAVIPGRMALLARARIVETERPAAAWTEDRTDPVVRAHLRMERLRELPRGGPIVDPRLVAQPLLLLGLAGAALAWWRHKRAGAALLTAMTLPFLVLSFVPFVSPAFGRLVLPWMAYRSLWMIPFGALIASLLTVSVLARVASPVRAAVAIVMFLLAMTAIPERRVAVPAAGTAAAQRALDAERMLARIAALPADVRVAAAQGFAESVPAIAGRDVASFADRGTVVFSTSRGEAEERLTGSALIVGLAPGSPRLRRSAAGALGVTHVVLENRGCGRIGRELKRSGALVLCEVSALAADRFRALRRAANDPRVPSSARTVASLGAGIDCRPVPEKDTREGSPTIHGWRRTSRWTATPVAVRCRWVHDAGGAPKSLRVSAQLPRARESLVYRLVVITTDGRRRVAHGLLELAGEASVEVGLPGEPAREIRLVLAPAYLPYLNLRELTLLD